jgi:DNA topoisomerase-1
MKEGEILEMLETIATERFTQRPARFTEAALVRKMEELGIGRPSTYAPTISTIINRGYVEKSSIEGVERKYNVLTLKKDTIKDANKKEITGADKNKLIPTDIGIVVNDFLVEFFPSVINYNFTAKVEEDFDKIAEGKAKWNESIADFYNVFHPIVEETANMRMEHKAGERVLGVDPKSGRQISVKIGRYGAMAQIGTPDEEEKPIFASLQKSQSIESITLEETLKLFELPRNLGEFREKDVIIGVGRFGPYIRHNNKFVSLPKGVDPLEIQMDEAIVLIEDKEKKDAEKIIKIFEEEPGLEVLNGRFGPYIKFEKSNYKIPKGTDPKELTIDDCKKIIAEGGKDKKSKGKKATTAKKTTATKKTGSAASNKSSSSKTKKSSTAKKTSAKKASSDKSASK